MYHSVSSLLFLTLSILNVEGNGELSILSAPKGLSFRENHELHISKMKDILATVLGYTVEQGYDWRGLEIINPFTAAAKALLIFYFPGLNNLSFLSKTSLPLIIDDDIDDVLPPVLRSIEIRYSNDQNILHKASLGSDANIIDAPNVHYLANTSESGQKEFINELTKLKNVVNQMVSERNEDGIPDIYWITLDSIAQKYHNEDDDSKELLALTLNALSEKVQKIYHGKIFIAAITGGEAETKVRSKREITEKSTFSLNDLNIAEDYSEDFPVIFNIILWLSVALLFSLIAISMVIAGMDPGRDSIIYRMTSTRMKKDN